MIFAMCVFGLFIGYRAHEKGLKECRAKCACEAKP
jgi:hypothetical protein